jgi:hypothetical protein
VAVVALLGVESLDQLPPAAVALVLMVVAEATGMVKMGTPIPEVEAVVLVVRQAQPMVVLAVLE